MQYSNSLIRKQVQEQLFKRSSFFVERSEAVGRVFDQNSNRHADWFSSEHRKAELSDLNTKYDYFYDVTGELIQNTADAIVKLRNCTPASPYTPREVVASVRDNLNRVDFYGFMPKPTLEELFDEVSTLVDENTQFLESRDHEEWRLANRAELDLQRHLASIEAGTLNASAWLDALYKDSLDGSTHLLEGLRLASAGEGGATSTDGVNEPRTPEAKIITANGDILSPMTRASLTQILNNATRGLESAQAREDTRIAEHFKQQMEAAEGLLGLIPGDYDGPVIGESAQAQDWKEYIERTTTDPQQWHSAFHNEQDEEWNARYRAVQDFNQIAIDFYTEELASIRAKMLDPSTGGLEQGLLSLRSLRVRLTRALFVYRSLVAPKTREEAILSTVMAVSLPKGNISEMMVEQLMLIIANELGQSHTSDH